MREFLRRLFLLHDRRERTWHVARLEYARWHTCLNCAHVLIDEVAFLWEVDGEIAAMLMPDGAPVEAHLMVHPAWRTATLEEEMLDVAEARLSQVHPDGSRRLLVWSPDGDALREEILARRGYLKEDWPEHQWRRDLDGPIPAAPLAAGYTLRPLGDGLEVLERCYASGLGFHDGDIQVAVENRQ
jgi:hypothetical protein